MKPSKNPPDPKLIFMQAQKFRMADEYLRRMDTKDVQRFVMILPPAIVLSAFSSELYFKCLICLETGKVPFGHHLDRLFALISIPKKQRILALWQEYLNVHGEAEMQRHELVPFAKEPFPRDLPTLLERGGSAFELMRYSYEGGAVEQLSFHIADLPRVLSRAALEIKPEWALLRPVVQGFDLPLASPVHLDRKPPDEPGT